MGCFKTGLRQLILVLLSLLHIQPGKVQGVDPVSQKLRRLTEQFQQFQALTQARLDMLALNQNRNSSGGLESRVQALSDRWQQTSQDLKDLKQNTGQEIGGLREWARKLEKKSKRIEGRLALMERNLRESRRHAQKQKLDPIQDITNLTLELQNQEERLAALQVQRDELLVGLKGLQESLKNQVIRVNQLEGRLGEVLQVNDGGNARGLWKAGEPLSSYTTSEKYYAPRRRSQTHRRGRPGRILDGQTQPGHEGTSYSQTDNHSKITVESRNPTQPNQYQGTPNQPKHPKVQKPRPQPESHPQIQYPNPEAQSKDYLPHPDPHSPQSQIQVPAKTKPPHQQRSQPQLYHHRHHSWSQPLSQAQTHPKPTSDRHGEEEQENNTKVESSVIHNLLQLPVRQKIPARPVPKKDATICNVDSMLFFPTASVENYVTFSLTLPNLHELSVCLWLRVEAQHVGTLLSYATDDNDNQLVLYGRNSSVSSKSFSSSSPSYPSLPSVSSSYSLDFVIGDPVYRRLPARLLLDAQWHHLCVLWSSIQGRFWHYSDRRLTSSGSNFRKDWEVPGGGSVVLGQEQDTVGGGFDPAEGFTGQVAGFRMWNRVLSPSEVEGIAEGRGVPRGVVLGMEDIKELHGEVQQVACECLEHCV
uniref:pentraxin-4 n=1 Tax=Semicossyphus pulcher TaxID=241346 RepID=UPI0037E82F7F